MFIDYSNPIEKVSADLKAAFSSFNLTFSEDTCADGLCYLWADDEKELCIHLFPTRLGEWEFCLVYNWSDPDKVIPVQAYSIKELKQKFYLALEGYTSVLMDRVSEVIIVEI